MTIYLAKLFYLDSDDAWSQIVCAHKTKEGAMEGGIRHVHERYPGWVVYPVLESNGYEAKMGPPGTWKDRTGKERSNSPVLAIEVEEITLEGD